MSFIITTHTEISDLRYTCGSYGGLVELRNIGTNRWLARYRDVACAYIAHKNLSMLQFAKSLTLSPVQETIDQKQIDEFNKKEEEHAVYVHAGPHKERSIRHVFGRYGRLTSVINIRISEQINVWKVCYEDVRDANDAVKDLNGSPYNSGKPIRVTRNLNDALGGTDGNPVRATRRGEPSKYNQIEFNLDERSSDLGNPIKGAGETTPVTVDQNVKSNKKEKYGLHVYNAGSVGEQEMRDAFGRYGKLTSVIRLPVSTMIVWEVCYEDVRDANDAAQDMCGRLLGEKQIGIIRDYDQSKPEPVEHAIYVHNTNVHSTSADIRHMFEKYGRVTSILDMDKVWKVCYEDERDANDAMKDMNEGPNNCGAIRVTRELTHKPPKYKYTQVEFNITGKIRLVDGTTIDIEPRVITIPF